VTGQDGYIPVPRETLDAVVDLLTSGDEHLAQQRAAAFEAGRQAAVTGDYEDGWVLGHDTGLSARQDSRSFVHGVRAGFEAGTKERKQLAEELLRRSQTRRPQRQADMEAEAS
jgi:hypothetical protein